jgi:TonB family protein
MFGQLVESKRKRERTAGGVAVSVIVHAGVLTVAAVATARGFDAPQREPEPPIIHFTPVPAPDGPPIVRRGGQRGATTRTTAAPPLPRRIDVTLPQVGAPAPPIVDVDRGLGALLATGHDLAGSGTGRGDAGAGGGAGSPSYVDTPAMPRGHNPAPVYPEVLRAARVEGVVTAQFVVDSAGRVDRRSIAFVGEGNVLFERAVRRALEQARFTPAMLHGRPVRMMMRQDFVFRIVGSERE